MKDICSLFRGIGDEEFKSIEKQLLKYTFHKNDFILRSGKTNKNLYIIKEGIVKVTSSYNGKSFTIGFLSAGDFFGEIGVFTDGQVQFDTSGITDSEIYVLKQEVIDKLILESPIFVYNFLHNFAVSVQKYRELVRDFAIKTVKQRVVETLIHLGKIFRKRNKETIIIDLPISQQEFANFVGSARENVGKILNELKKDGIIELRTKQMSILSEEKLLQLI